MFSITKNDIFGIYYQVNLTRSELFGLVQKQVVNLIKTQKSIFIVEKIKKYRKCPALASFSLSLKKKIPKVPIMNYVSLLIIIVISYINLTQ